MLVSVHGNKKNMASKISWLRTFSYTFLTDLLTVAYKYVVYVPVAGPRIRNKKMIWQSFLLSLSKLAAL